MRPLTERKIEMMNERESATLTVTVELDGMPGAFHTKEYAQEYIQWLLNNNIPHYNPKVILTEK